MTDIDGNTYKTIQIGKQIWMAENLRVSKFRNNDPILEAIETDEWSRAAKNKTPAWCHYENQTENGQLYGKLYNWHAVNDPRGLAPKGWHIPTVDEWKVLLKKCEKLGNKKSGFSGLPGGNRLINGNFGYLGDIGHWWSKTEGFAFYTWNSRLDSSSAGVFADNYYLGSGFSVRCVRD